MIFSRHQTVDLSELFLMLQNTFYEGTSHEQYDASNEAFLKQLYGIMVITGICDKNPAAIYDVARMQVEQPKTATYSLIQQKFKNSQLSIFFNSSNFRPYFGDQTEKDKAINYQAFCIAFVQHLSMRIELSRKSPEACNRFIFFLNECHYLLQQEHDFSSWYFELVKSQNIIEIVEQLFFSAIGSEVEFCHSQHQGLIAAVYTLNSLSLPSGTQYALEINPNVPEIDAQNLLTLHAFYESLTRSSKTQLIEELLFLVIQSAGAIYAKHPDCHPAILKEYIALKCPSAENLHTKLNSQPNPKHSGTRASFFRGSEDSLAESAVSGQNQEKVFEIKVQGNGLL